MTVAGRAGRGALACFRDEGVLRRLAAAVPPVTWPLPRAGHSSDHPVCRREARHSVER